MARRSRRSLTFKDAVRLLDDGSPFVRDLDELIEHAFDAVPVVGPLLGLPYFAFQRKLVEYGEKVVSGIRDRVDGVGRYDRTQRLNAAHTVIVMAAFADAVGELLNAADLQDEQSQGEPADSGMHGKLILDFEKIDLPDPGPGRVEWIESLYVLTEDLSNLLVTRGLDPDAARLDELPELARRRYEENYRRMAAEVPEFAVWAYLAEHEATRDGVAELGDELRGVGEELRTRLDALTTGLTAIPELLAEVSGHAAANRARTELADVYRAKLTRSVLGETRAPDGVALPTLEQGYVNPAARAAAIGTNCHPSEDVWWEDQPRYDDVQTLIVGALTTRDAADGPLVILGQPGAGKSVLTRMLAARLANRGFLPVRVELRNVQADEDVQPQIEHAIYAEIGRSIAWPDLADSARKDGLLPLIILDGFDELLQATGVNRSSYLEQVAAFQRRELDRGHPVAAIVTSRTAVAERARFPETSLALRLEPFDEARVRTWLGVWNEVNAAPLAARGVPPLDATTVLAYGELAEQPLLLILLALYDADTGALQMADAELSRAELYDRLLMEFARREVRKPGTDLDADDERRAVDAELHRLSIVALAMFNRHAQVITGTNLDRDLAALLSPGGEAARPGTGMAKPLTAAQLTVGRFFFVHESQAVRDDEPEHAYEFLHATFGEFLVARLVIETLRGLARLRDFQRREGMTVQVDDGELWMQLSFAALSGTAARIEFVEGLLTRLPETELAAVRALTVDVLRVASYAKPGRSYTGYQPDTTPVPYRHAYYSANLTLLAVLGSTEPLHFRPIETDMWREVLSREEFTGLQDVVRICVSNRDDTVDYLAVREDGSTVDPRDFLPRERPAKGLSRVGYFYYPAVPADSPTGIYLRKASYDLGSQYLTEAMLPYLQFIGEISVRTSIDNDPFILRPRALLELRLAPFSAHGADMRERIYRWCFSADSDGSYAAAVFRQLREDIREFPAHTVADLLIVAFDEDVLENAFDAFCDVLLVLRDTDDEALGAVADHIRERVTRAGTPEADAMYERMHAFLVPRGDKQK